MNLTTRNTPQVASFLGANVLMLFAPATRTISCRQFGEYKISLLVLSLVFVRGLILHAGAPACSAPTLRRTPLPGDQCDDQ